jgi:hypothetical protein
VSICQLPATDAAAEKLCVSAAWHGENGRRVQAESESECKSRAPLVELAAPQWPKGASTNEMGAALQVFAAETTTQRRSLMAQAQAQARVGLGRGTQRSASSGRQNHFLGCAARGSLHPALVEMH